MTQSRVVLCHWDMRACALVQHDISNFHAARIADGCVLALCSCTVRGLDC